MRGYRLADLLFGEDAWSPQELLAFIRWLPDTSAFSAHLMHDALKNPNKGSTSPDPNDPTRLHGWGRDRQLLAEIANNAQGGAIATIAVNTDRKNRSQIPRFRPTPTPFDARKPGLFERLAAAGNKK